MNIKRAVFMAVLVVAIAALALPLVGLRAAASGSAAPASASAAKARAVKAATAAVQQSQQQREVSEDVQADSSLEGKIPAATLKLLGLNRVANPRAASEKLGKRLLNKGKKADGGQVSIQSGQPLVLDARSALSDALSIAIGGRDNQFSEVALIADWDGREDCVADREQKVDDFSELEPEIDVELTRTAISEHTVANGFNQNVYYYGDSVGNLWVTVDTNPGLSTSPIGAIDLASQVNIVELVNNGFTAVASPLGQVNLIAPGGALVGGTATSGDCLDDQVVVTGIAVNPVADLGDFGTGLCGVIGEVVYVSVVDSEGCAKNAANQPLRTRIFAFGFVDSATGVTSVGAIQILKSKFINLAGVAVDDDGSLYYQLVDLITSQAGALTGGAILKATELCRTVTACPGLLSPRINRVITAIPDPPTLGSWVGTAANPVVTAGGVRNTNYGGGSVGLWGNIVAIATGPCNVLYAAVSRSFVAGDVSFDQLTMGLFGAPTQFGAAGTPSMVISFADAVGAIDACTGAAQFPGSPADPDVGGVLCVADGFADVANALVTTRIAGVNNFRIFVQGNGPNLAPAVGGTAVVPSTPVGLLKVDMQIDYVPAHAGLAVSGEGTVFVISGGAPAGVGKSPSPMLGEVLCFEDICPPDRRADFVDLRGDTLANPPASGGNIGDGDSDRFDHIFYQAPLDINTVTPAGLTGLARGFLRYTNRLAPNAIGAGVTLGVTDRVLPLNSTTNAAVIFEWLDPGHQVAGGDDQNTPNTGDDSDTVPGTTAVSSPPIGVVPNSSAPGEQRNGGFEFLFNGALAGGASNCVWNGFFWNSNGNITFGTGDTSPFANAPAFRQGRPKIAPAWTKLNPASRTLFPCTFPVMALGFENVNAFKIRWINVPEFGQESCTVNASNTFAVTLYDDGTGFDENTTETLSTPTNVGDNVNSGGVFDQKEGPTDLRFTREPNTNVLVGCPPRPEGSGIFVFEYCRMDLLGTADRPVLVGFSTGGTKLPFNNGLNPPGLCEINLSVAAGEAATTFGLLPSTNNQTATICSNCCIGEGTEPTLFELFNGGSDASIDADGKVTFAKPDFDLRFEGNDAQNCLKSRQKDLDRGKVCFFGIGCTGPANPTCNTVVAGSFVVPPNSGGPDLIDAICQVQLNLVGCGFFPNEVTTICSGFEAETGDKLQRPGKTVTTTATLRCDTNGDGVPDSLPISLGSVTPVSCNLLRATLNARLDRPGTAFPDFCCGGTATIDVVTQFTPGDNNLFGAFTRSTSCTIVLGTRAPVVFSVTPSGGDCSLPLQDLLVSGACFCAADGTF
ncbi:MAG: hypothetical protein AABN34_26355, partial [Acidobacteriota bacterium]